MVVNQFPYALLKDQETTLRRAVQHWLATDTAGVAPHLSHGAEWLLDNHYMAEQAVRQIRIDMPPDFLRTLPVLGPGRAGYPRIYAVAEELIRKYDAQVDSDRIRRFISLYEDTTSQPLTMGELWALPVMLRLCVLECLAQAVSRLCGLERRMAGAPMDLPGAPSDDRVIATCITSLRELSRIDWREFFEGVSRVDQTLRAEPAGVYGRMDATTRDRYRKVVEQIARGSGASEQSIAAAAVALVRQTGDGPCRAAHVGYFLMAEGRSELEARLGYRPGWIERMRRVARRHPTSIYLGGIALLTTLLLSGSAAYGISVGATPVQWIAALLLLLIPALSAAVHLANWLITSFTSPTLLPKLDLQHGVPDDCRTLIVIPCLLSGPSEVKSLLEQLEAHRLRSPGPNLLFALVSDFTDASTADLPGDDALICQAAEGIERLNLQYSNSSAGPFYLLHRERRWNPRQQRWMGWERKRGKLHELNRLMRGDTGTSFTTHVGELSELATVQYVITLDADTILPRGGARRLIGTLAHPLNRPELDEAGRVIHGYTILQPRVEIMPLSAGQSAFTRIFTGNDGLDLYTRAVSDVYQDLFGAGIYVGKGIYHVDTFERSLQGRVPENTLLSHDLFEGIHGRVGLVTDIALYEDYPPHYLLFVRRAHRWLRGDWQLLPWLLPRVPRADGGSMPNTLPVIDRWKIADNLRRSLLAPTLLGLFVAAWLWLPGSPGVWMVLGLAALAIPCITSAFEVALRATGRLRVSWQPLVNAVQRWLLAIVFIPYEAVLGLGGIAITLVRMYITRRNLLEWMSAAHASSLFGRDVSQQVTWRQMLSALLATIVLGAMVLIVRPSALPWALPVLAAWLISPEVAFALSRPLPATAESLDARDRKQLRRIARRTWLFFEQFVGPNDHWLPPDNHQEAPLNMTMSNTSPTNIGMLLLSTLTAHDLGYIGLRQCATRLDYTFQSLSRLERYRQHFLNWYDTHTLQPLAPRYVSTVDSGNLAGSLIAVAQGCRNLADVPVLGWQTFEGWLDALGLLDDVADGFEQAGAARPLRLWLGRTRERIAKARETPAQWPALLASLARTDQAELDATLMAMVESHGQTLAPEQLQQLRLFVDRARYQLESAIGEVELLLPWVGTFEGAPATVRSLAEHFPTSPRLSELLDVYRRGQAALTHVQAGLAPSDAVSGEWCARLAGRLDLAEQVVEELSETLRNLEDAARTYVAEMDFGFLYDAQRELFHIGYNLETGQLDPNYYDLLASEARIASLVAIAKNDVPSRHWLHLGRPVTRIDGDPTLLSWSATAFEYLMPLLLTRLYPGSLLDVSCRRAVDRQIAYGEEKRVPWGISESGYYAFDAGMRYQYRAFGVPGLGYRRGLEEDLVVASYACVLALPVRPKTATRNLARLAEAGMLGTYGYYEAIDFTTKRLALGQRAGVVKSYMAHHQGMCLVALGNRLRGDAMVRRFHADPAVRTVELLLQERVPFDAPPEFPQMVEADSVDRTSIARPETQAPWAVDARSAYPMVHCLSNGRFGTVISGAGTGVSRWHSDRTTDLTRWRADATLEDTGTWLFIRDDEAGQTWSAALQPVPAGPDQNDAHFSAHQAEFRRQHGGIASHLAITIAPEDDVEIRRLTLVNQSDRVRRLTVTSYGEVVLAPMGSEQRHPAFNKLFIAAGVTASGAQVFERRQRAPSDTKCCLAHAIVLPPLIARDGGGCTDRARFLGIRAAGDGEAGEGTLDPIFSLDQRVVLWPGDIAELAFVTCVASTREQVDVLLRRYRAWRAIDRTFDRARDRARTELRGLNMTASDLAHTQHLLSALLYPNAALRASPAILQTNTLGQSGLWAFGISGDHPILLVRLRNADGMSLLSEALRAHAYWRGRRLDVELVILNEQGVSYSSDFVALLNRTIQRAGAEPWLNRRGGIFVVHADRMSEAQHVLLETAARVVLDSRDGSLAQQLAAARAPAARLPLLAPTHPGALDDTSDTEPVPRPADLRFDNGYGGFSADGREYAIYLEPGSSTPAPWVNVIANAGFGCIVTESGLGNAWALNGAENRLTPWSNDPVLDPQGEALYLRDEETGRVWSSTRWPCGEAAACIVRHGAGYSTFETHSQGLAQHMRVFIAREAPVKIVRLHVRNLLPRPRRITVTYYAEWVLGLTRDGSAPFVVSEFAGESAALLARNAYHPEFGERVAFAAASKSLHGLTADRAEFLGRHGSYARPAALERLGLAGAIGAGLDPCAALQVHLDLPGDGEDVVYFVIGQGADRDQALQLVAQYRDAGVAQAEWHSVRADWDDVLDAVQVCTPEPAMDLMLNRWLLYPALSSRILGRTAFYQSSGAYGFRDQLQDVLAFVHARPGIAREQILRCARHQFEEGDVLHWWHPPSGRGVRTRCSDDLLWLPYATAGYVQATGDLSILEERIPFLQAERLREHEDERYGLFAEGGERHSIYEHCLRALERGDTRGRHGLPLMQSGDWNDGMNRVGIAGQGESVWLGWFLGAALDAFAEVCERKGDLEVASRQRARSREIADAIEASAWDGGWYRRAYFDDGSPLGSAQNDECRIDAIAQSWSALSGLGDPARVRQAMDAVIERLVRADDGLVLLFTPPFSRTRKDPGYIKGYPPGVRENGGQYTHGAIWTAWAMAVLGDGARAESLFRMLNPISHTMSGKDADRYRVEPYAIAADVYSVAPFTGRGGWTWYTGSNSWMYRLGLEGILGIQRRGDRLSVDPCIPRRWPGFEVTYRAGESAFDIRVENPHGVCRGVAELWLDDRLMPANEFALHGAPGRHCVRVVMADPIVASNG
jgi:cyclic beta-1,2-glucan synthetase